MKTIRSIGLLLQCSVLIFFSVNASAQLHADFSADPVLGCPPVIVSFKDLSTGNPSSWKWDLGNGTISFLKNPVATYFNPGSYNIKLIVKNENGVDSVVRSKYIVINSLPSPDFSASATGGCFPLKVNFKDSSIAGSGTITAWQWDFGDGALSNEQNPSHIYTHTGKYSVLLTVTNSNGCKKTITKSSFINLLNGVKADFTYTIITGCSSPSPVNFTNTTDGTGSISYLWDFGDGKTSTDNNPVNNYQKEGSYSVKLIAKNDFGCTDTMVKNSAINIGFVKANFTGPDTICAGRPFAFNNTSGPSAITKSSWDFGDGKTSDSLNPVHTYTAAGVYPVKLSAGFGACYDSVVKNITVFAKPVPGFTAVNNISCSVPLNVSFNNTTINAVSYFWDFGDSTTSTLQNPVHNYKKTGNYTVTLKVKNASGCLETLVRENFVKIVPPKIAGINNLTVQGCVPSVFTPVAVIRDSTPVSSYLWNFGDSTTSQDSAPTHIYTIPGKYTIKLTITTSAGCTDTLTLLDTVKVGTKPRSDFSADPLDVCAITYINFNDLSSNAVINGWSWNFGDGGTSSEQNPNHKYDDTGYFSITLIASNYGCSDTLAKVNYIHVRPPIARFDTAFFCNDPLKRNFINKSIGAIAWNWSFGDGTTSSDEQVSHVYSAPGIYNVVLKVTNGVCDNTARKDVIVIKENGKLQISDSTNCRNNRIIFNVANVTASNISTYSWYYNGLLQPAVITTNNPVATQYSSSGIKSTAAVITNILSCADTLYANVAIKIFGLTTNFGSSASGTCLGSIISFTDSVKSDGIHPVVKYSWNFGDGKSQIVTSSPVSHSYSSPGSYNIQLVAEDSYGCKDSLIKPSYISVTKPVAGFTASDTSLCPKSAITFNNRTQAVSPAYIWNFGDGTTSRDVSPVHSFSNTGVYKVRLLVFDKNGCSDSASINIKVFTAAANFSMSDSFSTCPPLLVNLTNTSSNYIQYKWNFGDGGNSSLLNPSHIYTYPGNYKVKLVVKNTGGCTDSLTRLVVVKGPTGTFDFTPKIVCNPGKVNFKLNAQNAVNYVWDYDDGNTVFSTNTAQAHIYTAPGLFVSKIILQDAEGCKVAITGVDTIKVNGIETHVQSNATVVCDSGYVSFKDSTVSNDVISGFIWNFGDGTTSTVRAPVHKYAVTGLYTISLIAKSQFGCRDTAVENKLIKIVNSPIVKISGDSAACQPALINFAANFVRKDTSAIVWNWNFGNNFVSHAQKPLPQIYPLPGSFTVTLKAVNSDGCADSVTKNIVIHPKPIVNAGNDTAICRFTSITLHATGADFYTWAAKPSLSCTGCATPVAKPDSSVTYYLTGKTIYNCENKDTINIKVHQPFTMVVGKTDTLCVGETAVLSATGAEMYEWTPSLWLNNSTTGTPVSKPDSTITYQVTGKDSAGCFVEKGSVRIKVYPIPVIEITNGHNITLQAGNSVQLTTKNSADITLWKWYPGLSLSCASCAQPVASPKENITYDVTASNPGNCQTHDQVTINVFCNNGNLFMPNTFSPNRDGVNDIFYPRGKGLYKIRSFKIFSRWGQVVFSKDNVNANDPADGWDGTSNGVALPDDVYVYIVEVLCENNTVIPFKGNITLLR